MTKSIITVSREFGSGGRTIAHKVAERLGVPYYDKELIKAVAEKTGFDPKFIEERGEYAPGRTIFSMLPVFDGTQGALSAADFLWAMQRQVILDLADKGPCVILGRCADYILRDMADCLKVFIHAGLDFRAKRIVEVYGEREASPEQRLKDKDKRRAAYHRFYTNMKWGQSQNYHIALDSGALGLERCAEIIRSLYE